MKNVVFTTLILLQMSSLFAQRNAHELAFELRYPKPIGDNFINKAYSKGYQGIIDLSAEYNFIRMNNLGIGLQFNSSVLRYSETELTLWVLSPAIKADYTLNWNKIAFIPSLAVGYSNWRFRASSINWTDSNGNPVQGVTVKENYNGFSCKGAAKVVLNNDRRFNWYISIAYEFTKLERPDNGAVDSKFNQNIQLLYPGMGVIWKFRKK